MASTIIDSRIFQGIFSSDAMRQVWSDENRTQKYLDIEAALARVQGRLSRPRPPSAGTGRPAPILASTTESGGRAAFARRG